MACSVISPAKENANNLIRTICFREKLVWGFRVIDRIDAGVIESNPLSEYPYECDMFQEIIWVGKKSCQLIMITGSLVQCILSHVRDDRKGVGSTVCLIQLWFHRLRPMFKKRNLRKAVMKYRHGSAIRVGVEEERRTNWGIESSSKNQKQKGARPMLVNR
jgi:hypothetical protein